VGGDVVQLARAVAVGSQDLAAQDDRRADRNLAARSGRLGLAQRAVHERVRPVQFPSVHIRSDAAPRADSYAAGRFLSR